jgi:hypothetical protein
MSVVAGLDVEGGAYVRFRALCCRQRKTARYYFGSPEVPREPFAWQAAGQSSVAPLSLGLWPGDRVLE